ncbi:MAG TPA: DM13 domain-containing protein [Acidimicrobiales bacterium]
MAVETQVRFPWQRAAGLAIPLALVAALALAKPEIVRGTFSSAESVLRVAAVVVGWTLVARLLRRVIANPVARTLAVAIPGTALLWVNVAPYFEDDVKIAGSFPEAASTATTAAADAPAAAADQPAPAAPAAPGTTAAPQPVQLTTGRFVGLDGHRGSGEAAIFRLPSGEAIVAFRDLSVQSVPDPVLYLVPGANRESKANGVRLGRFDGSRDRYEIPAGTDLSGPVTVLVWCERFAVPVAGATQTAA